MVSCGAALCVALGACAGPRSTVPRAAELRRPGPEVLAPRATATADRETRPFAPTREPERITRPAGPYEVTLHESRLAAGLVVPGEELASINAFGHFHYESPDDPSPHFDVFPAWSAALYEVLRDEFEFVLFVLANDAKPEALPMNGFTQRIRNDVRGLGIPLFDRTKDFGARGGRLSTIVLFTSRTCLRDGPLLHELAHRWGMNLMDAGYSWHNGFSSVGGQLGGFDTLTALGDGTWRATAQARPDGLFDPASPGEYGQKNQIPYAPLELYTMGLAPLSEVPDVTVLEGASWVDRSSGIVAGEPRICTAEEITRGDIAPEGADLADWGPRIPAYPNTQRRFTALAVYVSPAAVADAEWAEFLRTVAWAGREGSNDDPRYNFWEATAARAVMDFRIPESAIRDSGEALPGP